MCGEEGFDAADAAYLSEIPPRVRRRAIPTDQLNSCTGNTSACAEKSTIIIYPLLIKRKYLRVCGEENPQHHQPLTLWEIPPRVRRRDVGTILYRVRTGNTSACAEKRSGSLASIRCHWKYLRVCGEEHAQDSLTYAAQEIPPRVRRRASLSCDYITRIREFQGLWLITMPVVIGRQNP